MQSHSNSSNGKNFLELEYEKPLLLPFVILLEKILFQELLLELVSLLHRNHSKGGHYRQIHPHHYFDHYHSYLYVSRYRFHYCYFKFNLLYHCLFNLLTYDFVPFHVHDLYTLEVYKNDESHSHDYFHFYHKLEDKYESSFISTYFLVYNH